MIDRIKAARAWIDQAQNEIDALIYGTVEGLQDRRDLVAVENHLRRAKTRLTTMERNRA